MVYELVSVFSLFRQLPNCFSVKAPAQTDVFLLRPFSTFGLRRCYSEVLQVLCRCLCLPIWRENDREAVGLAQDIQRFFDIYERNLDRDLGEGKIVGVVKPGLFRAWIP